MDPEKSKGYIFYYPGRHTKFVETRQAVFLEDSGVSGSFPRRKVCLEELRIELPDPVVQEPTEVYQFVPPVIPPVQVSGAMPSTAVQQENMEQMVGNQAQPAPQDQIPQPISQPVAIEPVRRSQWAKRSAIPDYYETYLSEDVYDIGNISDLATFRQAVSSENSTKWIEAIEDELRSMSTNEVWDLVEIPDGVKQVGCKWVYKTKRDSKGKVERFKARLVAKGFTQKEGIDYN